MTILAWAIIAIAAEGFLLAVASFWNTVYCFRDAVDVWIGLNAIVAMLAGVIGLLAGLDWAIGVVA